MQIRDYGRHNRAGSPATPRRSRAPRPCLNPNMEVGPSHLFAPESWGGDARRKFRLIASLLLVLATLAVYNPVSRAPYLNYDDNAYVYENFHVRAGLKWQTVVWAFATNAESNWHPLTWLSHALDVELFGLNPAGPHYVNLLIHALNAVLLFLLLDVATALPWRSLAVASLFALHPINVESVAWIAERKNVLSMFFLLLALAAYGRYAKKPDAGRYLMVCLCFALGLMAKPQVITLPFALLLLDYWPCSACAPPGTKAHARGRNFLWRRSRSSLWQPRAHGSRCGRRRQPCTLSIRCRCDWKMRRWLT